MGSVATTPAGDFPQALSPVAKVSRGIRPTVQLLLYARAAGIASSKDASTTSPNTMYRRRRVITGIRLT